MRSNSPEGVAPEGTPNAAAARPHHQLVALQTRMHTHVHTSSSLACVCRQTRWSRWLGGPCSCEGRPSCFSRKPTVGVAAVCSSTMPRRNTTLIGSSSPGGLCPSNRAANSSSYAVRESEGCDGGQQEPVLLLPTCGRCSTPKAARPRNSVARYCRPPCTRR